MRTGAAVAVELAAALRACAAAARTGDADQVRTAREHGVRAEKRLDTFREALDVAQEAVRAAPMRWREHGRIERYHQAATRIGYGVTDTRVLLRRAVAAFERGEQMPPSVAASLDALAEALDVLRHEVGRGRVVGPPREPPDYTLSRRKLLVAARTSVQGLDGTESLALQVIVGQLRSVVVDLLVVTGLPYAEADSAVRAETSDGGVDGSDAGGAPERRAGPAERADGDEDRDA